MSKLRRRVALAATLATIALSSVMVQPAEAVVATTTTNYFAQFNNGQVGWYKVTLEKASSGPDINKGRAIGSVWCEPDTVLGGTKVACDAIDLDGDGVKPWVLSFQFSQEGTGWVTVAGGGHQGIPIDYSPPVAGLTIQTSWVCSGVGDDQYRAAMFTFRAAAGNQWSQAYDRATNTWLGSFC